MSLQMPEPQARPSGRTRRSRRSAVLTGAIGIAPAEPLADELDWQGSLGLTTAHCTIMVVDVEGFGRHSRTNPNKVRVRGGLYRAIERAFAAAGIPWGGCRHEDLGDGVLVLAPAHVSKALFVDLLLGALADELLAHNAVHPAPEQIRLRLALHAGEVSYDEHGVTGSSILHAQQLIDTLELKHELAQTTAVLAVIASDWVFDEVIRHSERSAAGTYRAIATPGGRAWMRLLARRRDLARWRRLG
jgi:class 3 adenylate cyclase